MHVVGWGCAVCSLDVAARSLCKQAAACRLTCSMRMSRPTAQTCLRSWRHLRPHSSLGKHTPLTEVIPSWACFKPPPDRASSGRIRLIEMSETLTVPFPASPSNRGSYSRSCSPSNIGQHPIDSTRSALAAQQSHCRTTLGGMEKPDGEAREGSHALQHSSSTRL